MRPPESPPGRPGGPFKAFGRRLHPRPLVYTREKALRDFSDGAGLPVIAENCPACFEEPKERHHVKKLLAKPETLFPNLFSCLCKALTPMMAGVTAARKLS